ncbi:hypothetical protein AALO_G00156790 [Alosa alosa]|uniref:Peptidase M1 membrane alanine aminopeptidase domain-containing protein n=1 Tax=Alosa alosa TaxID=278164 RepID=A0AAV6GJM0_9TELE|nr:hypothetical protein AALO_G00156790 [Alosa alosa]
MVVQKKDGTIRLCVDYHQLNAKTRRDAFPLPRIEESLDALSGATLFSTLDLASGYNQEHLRRLELVLDRLRQHGLKLKLNQIALPDFNTGAMENWGLITYRETALLYDPDVSSNGNKERIATIIAHELAHMKDLIVLSNIHRVFAVDVLASSHPLSSKEEEIQRPEQISELFDAISYSKTYLNEFAFNNTVYSDLWDHLQARPSWVWFLTLSALKDICCSAGRCENWNQ